MEQKTEIDNSMKAWAVLQKNRLTAKVISLQLNDKIALKKRVHHINNTKDYQPLAGSIGVNIRNSFGFPERVNFKFAKQGIFFETGVGKGRKKGSGQATPHPWLVPVLDLGIQELADILADMAADNAVGEIKFFIPGVVTRRVKISIRNGE